MTITKVAIAGGTGNLGPSIVKALLDADFEVTLLTRSTSDEQDPRTKIEVVDYDSLDSLTKALTGQDALVNVLGYGTISKEIHQRVVDAAYKAGLQRILPSEFGSDTTNPLVAQLPFFAGKAALLKHVQELAEKDKAFTWTALFNGPFLDWGLKENFILDLKGPVTPIYDGGDVLFSTTTRDGIAQAVVGVLKHPDETKNCPVFVAEAEVSQNQLLQMSGRAGVVSTESVRTEDLEQRAMDALQRTPPDHRLFAVNMIWRAIFSQDYGNRFVHLDNELLGVRELDESEVTEIVRQNCS
ncbi:oxidoreductase CipA [Penicillium malachiteum]|uniref:oxidoreductase CipA n=1 Tax=Penicillium malachiteum TaxID=1324776 RepID=UPI002546C07A|nr:oxidoreductase CipA [Penicillium malachiteum]KAJ5720815.1 oxidoreductase CipA [Penicillium malachiteum]